MLLINIELEAESGGRLVQFGEKKWKKENTASNPSFATHQLYGFEKAI